MEEEHDFFLAESLRSSFTTRFLLVLSGVLVTRNGAGRSLLNDEDGEDNPLDRILLKSDRVLFPKKSELLLRTLSNSDRALLPKTFEPLIRRLVSL